MQKRVYYFNKAAHDVGVPTLEIQYESIQTDERGVLKVRLPHHKYILCVDWGCMWRV